MNYSQFSFGSPKMSYTGIVLVIYFGVVQFVVGAPVKCEPSRRPYAIPDDDFCDKFTVCDNMTATEQLCDDGLVFDGDKGKCDFPHVVDCGKRTKLQPPKPSGNCPRRNGMFAVEGSCDQFYHCTSGLESLIRCPQGVIFEPKMGACVHPDLASRPNCSASAFLDFECPNIKNRFRPLKFGDHDRLPHPTNCRYFYMCLLTGMPRLGGCNLGLVFNPKSGRCDRPKNVPGCETYYGDMGDEEEEDTLDSVPENVPVNVPISVSKSRPTADAEPELEAAGPKAVFPEFRKPVRVTKKRPVAVATAVKQEAQV